MGILQQIKNDVAYLKKLILSLTNKNTSVTTNGVHLTGDELEQALAHARAENTRELNRLELILESGVIPDKYKSIITKQTYYPSNEELKIKANALPPSKHTFFCIKTSKGNEGLKNSKMKLIHDDKSPVISFFMEHKNDGKYPRGGFAAKVKQGYLTEETQAPKYAVKIYHKKMFNGDTIHELRLAMRASYCYKQLGREGYAFRRNGKQYMTTEWITGVNLDSANQDQVQEMPIPQRIVMAISLFRELNVFHKQGLIHHDIKPSNVMVNYGKLCFVDLDSVAPKGEKPLYGTTPLFTSTYLPSAQMRFDSQYNSNTLYLQLDEETDIHAMGITLACLFQEIYLPKLETTTIEVNGGPIKTFDDSSFSLYHGPKYTEHTQLQKLIKNMVFRENEELCSCDDYIEALKDVLTTYPDYEQYLVEDKLVNLVAGLNAQDGKNAFREIEIELLGYNQRHEAVSKLSL